MIIPTTIPNSINNSENFTDSEDAGEYYQELGVEKAQHGWRLDKFLVSCLDGLSRHYLQQLIKEGAVTEKSSGIVAKAATKVKWKQIWQVTVRPLPQNQAFVAQPVDFTVAYADADLIVVNKPPGLVVHPAPGNWSGTLLNGLLWQFPELTQLPRAGIVHRLDKDTSGLMVVARTRASMDALVELIASRQIKRTYLAVVGKNWTEAKQVVVEKAIGRDTRNRIRMAVVDLAWQHGKEAKTKFELLRVKDNISLLKCQLYTGRTHQIRVHLRSLGYPLLADTLYGGAKSELIERQALHAWQLRFIHPQTRQPLHFIADIPSDWQKITQVLALTDKDLVEMLHKS